MCTCMYSLYNSLKSRTVYNLDERAENERGGCVPVASSAMGWKYNNNIIVSFVGY